MYIHTAPAGPARQDVLDSLPTGDYQLVDGTNMKCLTPQLFEDAIHSVIFCTFHTLYRPHEAHKASVWFPGKLRRRVFVALYAADRWADVGKYFEDQLGVLPFSIETKIAISMEFFGHVEPNLWRVCQALANEPGFICTTESVFRIWQ